MSALEAWAHFAGGVNVMSALYNSKERGVVFWAAIIGTACYLFSVAARLLSNL